MTNTSIDNFIKKKKPYKKYLKVVTILSNFYCTTFLFAITGRSSAEILRAPSSLLRCHQQTRKKVWRNRNWNRQELLWPTHSMERGTFKQDIFKNLCFFWFILMLFRTTSRNDTLYENLNRWQQCKEEVTLQCWKFCI